jgi:1,6-anhydro-N-acetylmuramate kinase
MTVYIDDARIRWRGRHWSHLVADTPEELHEAAGLLGLRREWAQERGRTLHYDLPDELRERAIALGVAEPISWQELAERRSGSRPAL